MMGEKRHPRPRWRRAGSCVLLASLGVAGLALLLLPTGVFLTLAGLLVFVDSLDGLLRLLLRDGAARAAEAETRKTEEPPLRPYALVMSVHNLGSEVGDLARRFEPFRDRLWIVDDGSSDRTTERLRSSGLRCLEGRVNRKKPGAIRWLLKKLPGEIETVVVLDPDITLTGAGRSADKALERVIRDFQRRGLAAITPAIRIRPAGLLARFQALEYYFSLSLGRRSLLDHAVNSGVSMYRRAALEHALAEHSRSVYAEDLETSLILLGAGERISFEHRWVVETSAVGSLRRLFSQRVGWHYGLLRVYIERFGDIARISRRGFFAAYHFLIYTGVFTILFQPARLLFALGALLGLAEIAGTPLGIGPLPGGQSGQPSLFVLYFSQYTILALVTLMVAVPRVDRARLLPVAPLFLFYVVVLCLPATVGYLNWVSLRLIGRRVYSDHYMDSGPLRDQLHHRRRKRRRVEGQAA